jgi:hypothetical protein
MLTELVMRLRPPTSNGTDMGELALFEDKILGIRSRCDGYQLGEDQGGRRQRYVLRLNHRRFRET